jgi:S-formylglutathione hydrolase FrmB
VKTLAWPAALVVVLFVTLDARSRPVRKFFQLARANRHLHGQVIDYTCNHGHDHRIYSPALGEKRDLYVYLPPGFDPEQRYPLILYLHGFAQDESSLLRDVVPVVDQAIACGKFPPVVIAAPDGSLQGTDCLFTAGSFFLNSKAGRFEDFLIHDVWNFLMLNYPLCPEPEAHAVVGASMGGGAAFNKAIKYPDLFRVVVGIFPPVNSRWVDCHGRHFADFDPCCWGWRTDFSRPWEVVGRFYGVIRVKMRQVTGPLYGKRNPNTAALVSQENPIEMLDSHDVRPGQLQMYIAYGGRDEFNIDAQVESFLYRARERGLHVAVGYEPQGRHNRATAQRLIPNLLDWLAVRLAPYAPCVSCGQ